MLRAVATVLHEYEASVDCWTQLRAYLRLTLSGPPRNSKGDASSRFRASLPKIVEQISELNRSALTDKLRGSAAASAAPSRPELQAELGAKAALVDDLRNQLRTAQGAKRKARFEARANAETAKSEKWMCAKNTR